MILRPHHGRNPSAHPAIKNDSGAMLSGVESRFIVRADEMLTAFVELQRAIHEFAVSLIS